MKKIYTLIGCLFLTGGIYAQKQLPASFPPNKTDRIISPVDYVNLTPLSTQNTSTNSPTTSSSNKKNSVNRAEGDTIFYDSFDDIANWTASPQVNCADLNVAGSQGWNVCSAFPTYLGQAINSNTPGSHAVGYFNGSFTGVYNVLDFTSNAIDISTHTDKDVSLSFLLYGAKWYYDLFYVEISTDGGTNWIELEEILSGLTEGEGFDNSTLFNYNITPYTYGKTSLRIRFSIYAAVGHYGFMIDDVLVSEGNPEDLAIEPNFTNTSGFYSSYLNDWGSGYYSIIPRKQYDNLLLGMDVSNIATSTANNVVLSAEIYHNGNFIYTGGSTVVNNFEFLDVAEVSVGHFPLYDEGDYYIEFMVSSDLEESGNLANNSAGVSFSVSETTYARDKGTSDFGLSAASWSSTDPDYRFAQYFEFKTADQISEISFYVETVAAGGASVFVEIWDADLTTSFLQEVVTLSTADAGSWYTLSMSTPFDVNAEQDIYVVISNVGGGADDFEIGSHDHLITPFSSNWYNNGLMYRDAQWRGGFYSYLIRINTVPYSNPCDDMVLNETISEPSCFGDSDGSITLAPTGGTPVYFYAWSNGQMTPTANGLAMGYHTVSVTDGAGCKRFRTFFVDEPSELALNTTSSTKDNCSQNDGTASVSATGGTPTYNYLWSNGQTTNTATGLASGTYNLTITDANGCAISSSVAVEENNPVITVDINTVEETCGNIDGSASVSNPQGSVGAYTYEWSNGTSTASINDVSAGIYGLTVTDGLGCTAEFDVTVDGSDAVIASTSVVNATDCVTANGEATITPDVVSTSYTYEWSNSETTDNIVGLSPDVYYVTITDSETGCYSVYTALVGADGSTLASSTSSTPADCYNTATGTVEVIATGGTTDYSYDWYTIGETTASVSNLSAGMYYVKVTDADNCVVFDDVEVTQPDDLVLSYVITNTTCNGDADGEIDLTVTGGNGSFEYIWSGDQTTDVITNLIAGTNTVTVSDAKGCEISEAIIVGQPDVLVANVTITQITCNGLTNGVILAGATGGNSGGYTYLWSNNSTTASISGLSADNYTVTVSDMLGCNDDSDGTIVEPSALSLTVSNGGPVCEGTTTSITAVVSGGTPAYTYKWAHTTFNISTHSNRPAGTYSITVTDSRGCNIEGSTTIENHPGGAVTVTAVVDKNSTGTDGEATATATGGTSPYVYNWTHGPQGATATGLDSTSYSVTAIDINGCISNTFSIDVLASFINSNINNLSTFGVYPNPNSGIFNVKFNNAENDTYTFEVRNLLGQVISSENVAVSGSFIKEINLTGVNTGVYFLNVRNSQGEKTERIIVK
jgi:hypothetical protein